MIEFEGKDIRTLNRRSSKGNQMKFERDGFWYKTDYLGYEGLAEYVVSLLLSFSTLGKDEFIRYDLEQISYHGNVFHGCRSRDFLDGWQLITLERLLEQTYGQGMSRIVYSIPDHQERLKTLVNLLNGATGLDFGVYMSQTLTVDTFFLNEDRHSHNLAVLTNDRHEYRYCPIFDNGAALMSDTSLEYPLHQDPLRMIPRVKPKTFCESFDEQLDIAEALYGNQIHFSFTYQDISDIVHGADGLYSPEVLQRVIDILMHQRRKYAYLF